MAVVTTEIATQTVAEPGIIKFPEGEAINIGLDMLHFYDILGMPWNRGRYRALRQTRGRIVAIVDRATRLADDAF